MTIFWSLVGDCAANFVAIEKLNICWPPRTRKAIAVLFFWHEIKKNCGAK